MWGPTETLHQGTALSYTSFLGLSEGREKTDRLSDREETWDDFIAAASVCTVPTLLPFSLILYCKVSKIMTRRKNPFHNTIKACYAQLRLQ